MLMSVVTGHIISLFMDVHTVLIHMQAHTYILMYINMWTCMQVHAYAHAGALKLHFCKI